MNKGSGSGIFPDTDPDPGDPKRPDPDPDPQHCYIYSIHSTLLQLILLKRYLYLLADIICAFIYFITGLTEIFVNKKHE